MENGRIDGMQAKRIEYIRNVYKCIKDTRFTSANTEFGLELCTCYLLINHGTNNLLCILCFDW